MRPHRLQPTRLSRPWDSPGKNTGVGCHFLLQCMKVKSEKWSRSVVSDSQRPHGLQPTRLLCPWDFPGKSTGVGCHCLLHMTMLPTAFWKSVVISQIHQTSRFSHNLITNPRCCFSTGAASPMDWRHFLFTPLPDWDHQSPATAPRLSVVLRHLITVAFIISLTVEKTISCSFLTPCTHKPEIERNNFF